MSTSGIEHACMASRVCDGERESELGAIAVCRAETPAAICTVDLTTFGVVASERASVAYRRGRRAAPRDMQMMYRAFFWWRSVVRSASCD